MHSETAAISAGVQATDGAAAAARQEGGDSGGVSQDRADIASLGSPSRPVQALSPSKRQPQTPASGKSCSTGPNSSPWHSHQGICTTLSCIYARQCRVLKNIRVVSGPSTFQSLRWSYRYFVATHAFEAMSGIYGVGLLAGSVHSLSSVLSSLYSSFSLVAA